jgi:hypothetical protein
MSFCIAQKSRHPAPDVDIANVQEIPLQGGKNEFLYGDMDVHDMDSSDRLTAGMSNMLRDQTVVVDTQTGGHATTSDDLAGALINANPSRFQSVSPSGYIPGIDY